MMSDGKRKNARLQGRFSDEHRGNRKEKQKRASDSHREDAPSSSSIKGKNPDSKSLQAVEGFSLEYDEHAKNTSFEQLEEKIKPLEIKNPGIHVLSSTENGISRVIFDPEFISKDEADEYFTIFRDSTPWYDKNIIIHGKEVPQPRQVAWFGPFPYAYSGAILDAAEMTPTILGIKDRVEMYLKSHDIDVTLNSVLLNFYRNEKDSVAWHSDDELSLGICPTIASVSFGEVRKFQMKIKPYVHDSDKSLVSSEYFAHLTHGSLIIMDGCMQKDWKHQVPKEYHNRGPRINLTFRTVYSPDNLPSQVPLKTNESSNNFRCFKKEESKPIFDSNNFPPLCAVKGEDKLDSSSIKFSKSKLKNKMETYASTNHPIDTMDSTSDSLITEDNFGGDEKTVPSQEFNAAPNVCNTLPDNGNSCVATPADITMSSAQSEEVNFIPHISNISNDLDCKDESIHAVPVLQGETEKSPLMAKDNKYDVTLQSKSQLNAFASEFVPAGLSILDIANESAGQPDLDFDKVPMTELFDWYETGKVTYPQFDAFSSFLSVKVENSRDIFSERDHLELDVLLSINDDSQNEKNRNIILKRLCYVIQNAAKFKSSSNYHRSQNSRAVYRDYRGNNSRYRNFNRGGGYKAKVYKD